MAKGRTDPALDVDIRQDDQSEKNQERQHPSLKHLLHHIHSG